MLTIRKEQLDALGMERRRDFEDRLMQHIAKFFPHAAVHKDREAAGEFIRLGCHRAAGYGFRSEREVCKYIDLMCAVGPNFDTDPQHRWATELLARANMDSKARMNALVNAAAERCRARNRLPSQTI